SIKNHDVRNDLDKYFYRTAVNQQYAFNVSGNTPYVNYYMSAGYDDNMPSLTGERYNRISLLSQNSFKPAKNLQVTLGVNYVQTNNRSGNNQGYNFYSAVADKQYYPYAALADANGNALPVYEDYFKNWVDTAGDAKLFNWVEKPLADVNEVVNKSQTIDYLINTGISYNILPALSISAKYQYEHQLIVNSSLYKQDAYYTRNLLNNYSSIDPYSGAVTYNIPAGGILDMNNGALTSHQGRAQLNYNHGWSNNKHQLTAIAGFEINSTINSTATNRLYGYDEDHNTINAYVNYNVRYLQFSYPGFRYIPNNATITSNTDHFMSYYANAAYTYKSVYTLSASARTDEANLFGVRTNQKGTPLWSAGASWYVSKENFYKFNWLPLFKLRITYGFNGNISRQATAYTTIEYNTGALTPLPIAFVTNPANPNLKWERTGTLNIGADFSLKNDIVSGTVEYYQKHARDLLGPAPLDPTLGIGDFTNPSYYGNVAGMNGNGIDVQLNTKNIN
ncbi:MAG TPA: TonB-dependent receptor, partial [Chitinophagales bacterium]|nr:TonB-dependent receptor [Chitinophagales bacterium]